jgi:hypothetical protein
LKIALTTFNSKYIHWNRALSFALAAMIKRVLPEAAIVLGGPEVSHDVERIFAGCPEADFIVQGEGEEIFSGLLKERERGGDGRGVPGAAWKGADGRVRIEGGARTLADLSLLKFPYDLAGGAFSGRILYYESARGCPYHCAYCLSGAGGSVRFAPVGKVLDDLALFIKAGVRQVKFVDRTYNLSRRHYLPAMRYLAARQTMTNFHFEIRADILDAETLDFLKSAPPGRFQFEIGVQSAQEKTLAAIGRGQDFAKIASAVGKLRASGNIHLHLDLIAGLPYETAELFRHSFNKVYALSPHVLQIGFLKILKGSPLATENGGHGYIFMPEPPYEVLGSKYIGYAELRQIKIFGRVFAQTYNSGKFSHTLDFLVKEIYRGDAYSFYAALAAWLEEGGLLPALAGPKAAAGHLAAFVREKLPDAWPDAQETLKADIVLNQEKSFRPDFIIWQKNGRGAATENFWRNGERAGKYLPGYTFTNWREIGNKYQIETFRRYFAGAKLTEPLAVLFLLAEKKWRPLARADFDAEDVPFSQVTSSSRGLGR